MAVSASWRGDHVAAPFSRERGPSRCVTSGMLRLAGLAGSSSGEPPGRLVCVPSQKGASALCLQPHRRTSSSALRDELSGSRPVPLCEPSQKGWLAERPQRHQKIGATAFETDQTGFRPGDKRVCHERCAFASGADSVPAAAAARVAAPALLSSAAISRAKRVPSSSASAASCSRESSAAPSARAASSSSCCHQRAEIAPAALVGLAIALDETLCPREFHGERIARRRVPFDGAAATPRCARSPRESARCRAASAADPPAMTAAGSRSPCACASACRRVKRLSQRMTRGERSTRAPSAAGSVPAISAHARAS